MDEKRIATLARSITALKKKGVTAIKVELEADMSRRYGNYESVEDCLSWLLDKISEKTNTGRNDNAAYDDGEEDGGHEYADVEEPFDWMTYARFYEDGSVDSELTFTIPIADESNIRHLPAVLEAFKDFGGMCDGFDTSGAGMHIGLLFSRDCSYPTPGADRVGNGVRLGTRKLNNFKRAVTQLLPALFFLGSSNATSRNMLYRKPRVSIDHAGDDRHNWQDQPKYSAITYRSGAIEFRLFETCYDSPLTILDNIIVIANCMKYLSHNYISPEIDKICSSMLFGNDDGTDLGRLYITETHLDVLNEGLKRIKPAYYTLTDLKRQRGFTKTKSSLATVERDNQEQASREYEEYKERFEWSILGDENYYRGQLIREYVSENTNDNLRGQTPESLQEHIQGRLNSYIEEQRSRFQPQEQYIQNRINQLRRTNEGDFRLSFS